MDRKELYEKLYFHEIEQRDKLASRLQLPLAIILTLIGFLGALLKNVSLSFETKQACIFWFSSLGASIALLAAIYFFIRALWGNTYTFLAPANQCEEYFQALIESHSDKKKGKKLAKKEFENYIFNNFKEYSSQNGLLNDLRSLRIYKSIWCLIVAIFFSMTSFGGYYFGSLSNADKAQPLEVIIKKPISTEDTKMTEKQTPVSPINEIPVKQPVAPEPRKVVEDTSPKQSDPTIINERTKR